MFITYSEKNDRVYTSDFYPRSCRSFNASVKEHMLAIFGFQDALKILTITRAIRVHKTTINN